MSYPNTLEYAGFVRRALAKIVDFAIVYSLVIAFMTAWSEYAEHAPPSISFGLCLSPCLFIVGYSAGFVERFGATPGKLLLRLRVVSANGTVTSGRAFGRAFAEFVTFMVPLYIGYFMAAFDDEKRALHDRICDTRVIRKR